MKTLTCVCVISTLSFAATVRAAADSSDASQNISVQSSLQVPGAVLPPGQYILSVEDRLSNRAILRLANTKSGEHRFLLTVPTSKIAASHAGRIVFFDTTEKGKQVLRAWSCPGCDKALEMVYPKEEAAKITAATGQSVLATDPSYDRLPPDLSADDMKVVTLWLLSPQRVSGNRGYGLKAAKYVVPTVETLPATASNIYSFGLAGILLLVTSLVLRTFDERRKRCLAF